MEKRAAELLSSASVAAAAALLSLSTMAHADIIPVVDVIPNAASGETGQYAEPSLAVDPLNPNLMIAGTFDSTSTGTPYWRSANGGSTWSSFDNLASADKSIAWRQDGVAALTVTLNLDTQATDHLTTYQSGSTNFGSPINTTGEQNVDQPWIRTGPNGHTYYHGRSPGFAGEAVEV